MYLSGTVDDDDDEEDFVSGGKKRKRNSKIKKSSGSGNRYDDLVRFSKAIYEIRLSFFLVFSREIKWNYGKY